MRGNPQALGQPLGDLARGTALVGFELADSHHRAAHLAGKLVLGHIQGSAAQLEPAPARCRSIHRSLLPSPSRITPHTAYRLYHFCIAARSAVYLMLRPPLWLN